MDKMYRILGKRGRITIPFEIRMRMGFSRNDILSFTESEDGSSVIVKREKICDRCREQKETLVEFLNSLSETEQRTALIHLSVKWAEKQGGKAIGTLFQGQRGIRGLHAGNLI